MLKFFSNIGLLVQWLGVVLFIILCVNYLYRHPEFILGKLFYYFMNRFTLRFLNKEFKKPEEVVEKELQASEQLEAQLDRNDNPFLDLPNVQVVFSLEIERTTVPVVGVGKLKVLMARDGGDPKDKSHYRRDGSAFDEYRGIHLYDGRYVIQLPTGEGKKEVWYLLTPLDDSGITNVDDYLRNGNQVTPGPVNRFMATKQKGPTLFNDFVEGNWMARDIAWYEIETRGEFFAEGEPGVNQPPWVVFFVSRKVDDTLTEDDLKRKVKPTQTDDEAEWLMTVSPRKGNVTPVIFHGTILQPWQLNHVMPIEVSKAAQLQ